MGAPAARVHEICKHWVESGAEVSVITAFPHHPTGIVPREYRGYWKLREQIDGINVIRTYIYVAPNKGLIKRMISYLSFMISSIVIGAFVTPKVDVVVATSPQFLCAVSGMVLSLIKGKPYVMEVRDLWPDAVVAVGALSQKSVIIKGLYVLEKIAYYYANKIVIVSDGFRSVLLQKGVSDETIHYFPNGIDTELFYPRPKDVKLLDILGLKSNYVVSYIGTHGMAHALDNVLDTAEIIDKVNNDIVFLFVGEGACKDSLKKLYRKKKLSNCMFVDQIDKKEIPKYYSISDVSLVVLKRHKLFETVLPSKMFESMGMAKPIILGVEGEARKVLDKARAGISVVPEDSKGMAEAILAMHGNPSRAEEMGETGNLFVRKHFNRKAIADRYLDIL